MKIRIFVVFKSSKLSRPIYSLYSSVKKSAQDFCFINENSVFATISLLQKPSFSVWDMLLPPNSVSLLKIYSFYCDVF